MAIHKRFEIVGSDTDHRIFMAIQDFRNGHGDGRVEITLKDDDADQSAQDMGFDKMTIWLTTEEVSELHMVLSSLLDIVTPEVAALRNDG